MTPVSTQGTFKLHCTGHDTGNGIQGGVPFELPYSDLVHLRGNKIVYYAVCPHGERVEIEDGSVPHTPEVIAATSALREVIRDNRGLEDWAELKKFLHTLPPLKINW